MGVLCLESRAYWHFKLKCNFKFYAMHLHKNFQKWLCNLPVKLSIFSEQPYEWIFSLFLRYQKLFGQIINRLVYCTFIVIHFFWYSLSFQCFCYWMGKLMANIPYSLLYCNLTFQCYLIFWSNDVMLPSIHVKYLVTNNEPKIL